MIEDDNRFTQTLDQFIKNRYSVIKDLEKIPSDRRPIQYDYMIEALFLATSIRNTMEADNER